MPGKLYKEIAVGLLILAVIISISGCFGSHSGGGGGGGYIESTEKREAREKIEDVEDKIEDCEEIIDKADRIGVKPSLIAPARNKVAEARKLLSKAREYYYNGDYDNARSYAEKAESKILEAREYVEDQIEKFRAEVKKKIEEAQKFIESCEKYIFEQSKLGINVSVHLEMIELAKNEIEEAWSKYDEEIYPIALQKCEKARVDARKARNLVALTAERLAKETLDIATNDVYEAGSFINDLKSLALVDVSSANDKLEDAVNCLSIANEKAKNEDYKSANDYALKASRLARIAKSEAEKELERFVEKSLVDLGSKIKEVRDDIDKAKLSFVDTGKEESELEDVKEIYKKAKGSKMSGDFLEAAKYISEAYYKLNEIEISLMKKKNINKTNMIIAFGTVAVILILTITLFGRRRK